MTINRIIVGELQTNCYIIESEGEGIVIDPGAEPEGILNESKGINIILILLTHNHFDHIGGVVKLKAITAATTAIHPLDWIDGFDKELNDREKIDLGEEQIDVIHTPGHTPGSCCFFVKDILFSGDTLFPGGPGNTSLQGGDENEIKRSIKEKLLSLPDETKVYPGHGPSTTIGNERYLY